MPTTNIRVDHNNSSTLYFSQRFFNSFFPPIKLDQGPLGWKLVPLKISSPLFMQEEDDIRDLRDFWGHSGNLDQHLMIFHWHRFFAISNIWGHPYTTWPVFWEFWPPSWPNVAFLGTLLWGHQNWRFTIDTLWLWTLYFIQHYFLALICNCIGKKFARLKPIRISKTII